MRRNDYGSEKEEFYNCFNHSCFTFDRLKKDLQSRKKGAYGRIKYLDTFY